MDGKIISGFGTKWLHERLVDLYSVCYFLSSNYQTDILHVDMSVSYCFVSCM